MFRKTRNRIMLVNMAMVSAVVIVAFAVIFAVAYSRERNSNTAKLYNYITPHVSVAGGPFVAGTIHAEPLPDELRASGFSRLIMPGAGLSFSILVDNDGNLIEVNSMLDLPDAVYKQAAAEITVKGVSGATVSLEGRTWQYATTPITVEFWESSSIAFFVSGVYSDVRFLDVTDSYRMLRNLGLTLAGLMAVILTSFFFISRYFANRAVRPMEEAFEKQSRFVADASHELKTPLSTINANCGVLYANKEETMDSQIKWVDSIMRASDRMNGLIGDLLSLARMEDNGHELHITAFDLSAAISGALTDTEQAAADKGLAADRQIEPDIEVISDREDILRIAVILLDNAVKYTDEGGSISVSLKKEKRCAVFTVRNSGEGIPQEELPRLFDRFYRGDPARSSDVVGYGLGLAIAGAAAERLGAKLVADSEPGYTEFRLLIDV